MIELVPAEHDDVAFLSLVQRIINGAIASFEIRDVFLVHVDTWFDYKWLGWWSRREGDLRVPPFTPRRVRSEKRLLWDLRRSAWVPVDRQPPLHVRRPGRRTLAQPIDRFSRSAAFIWYSGNTLTNTLGSLMFYRSGADGYAWYASIQKREHWAIAEQLQIRKEELLSFEQRGRQMELARV